MLSILTKVLLVIVVVVVLLAPNFVLALSGVKFQRTAGGRSGWFILVGAVLLAITALEWIYMAVLAALMTAEELGRGQRIPTTRRAYGEGA